MRRLETDLLLRRARDKVLVDRTRKCSTGDSGPSSEPDSIDSESYLDWLFNH